MIRITDTMVDRALASLFGDSVRNVGRDDVRRALEAALGNMDEPEQAGTLSRADAMDKARELVDGLSTAPVKANGYAVDGWKAPILGERTDAILRLAAFLSGGEQE